MARVRDHVLTEGTELSLTLDRYQEKMQIPIGAFNGLNWVEEVPVHNCSGIWNQTKRDMLAMYISKAEEIREQHLNYFLSAKQSQERFEYGPYDSRKTRLFTTLSKKRLISMGQYTISDIELSYPLVLRDVYGEIYEPVPITFSTTITSKNEIIVCYPGEDVRIKPEKITISGGVCTVLVPRSRLVKPELLDDREDHLQYNDDANFLEEIDLKRRYVDTDNPITVNGIERTTGQEIFAFYATGNLSGNRAARISTVRLNLPINNPINCVNGSLIAYVNYISGYASDGLELDTARLAHTYMPHIPCSCPLVAMYWQQDTAESKYSTPYGNKAGAVQIYTNDMSLRIISSGSIP